MGSTGASWMPQIAAQRSNTRMSNANTSLKITSSPNRVPVSPAGIFNSKDVNVGLAEYQGSSGFGSDTGIPTWLSQARLTPATVASSGKNGEGDSFR